MKKSIVLIIVAFALVAGFQACQKEEGNKTPFTQTVNVTLKMNESYTFTLPLNHTREEYRISSAAGHSSVSDLGKDGSEMDTYHYTPAMNYSGSDQVVISNEKGEKCFAENDIEGKQHSIITLNFTIGNPGSSSDK